MIGKRTLVVALGLACAAVGAESAQAAVISGTLNITGAAAASVNSVDFYALGGGTGTVSADLFTQLGSFGPAAGTTGTIKDFASLTPGSVNIPNFLTFASLPGVEIDLTGIQAGVLTSTSLATLASQAPASGQTATPTGTAYNMTNLALPDTVLSWSVTANAVDIGSGDVTPMTGVFTMQYPTLPMQSVAAAWLAGGAESASFSATFTAVVPEPASLGLLAVGAMGLLGGRRRRR